MCENCQKPLSLWIFPGLKTPLKSWHQKMPWAMRKSPIKTFAVLSNYTLCKVFNLKCASKSEQWRKTSRFLWNQEGVFLSGNKASAWELTLGIPDLPPLGAPNGFSGFQAKHHEGQKRPHPKMPVHEPKAMGCWSLTWSSENLVGPFVGIAENWRLCVWMNFFWGVTKVRRLLEEAPCRHQESSEERLIWGKKSLQLQYWITDRVGLLNFPWLP